MERWVVALHSVLVLLTAAAVWRVWVLCRQVRAAADACRSARSDVSREGRGAGAPVSVHHVHIHASAAAGEIPVRKIRPDRAGGPREASSAVPILMRRSPGASLLAGEIDQGGVTHCVAGSVVFEALSGGTWEASGDWSRPASASGDVLVWARPLSGGASDRFPFPPLGPGSSLRLGEPEGSHAPALVLAL